LELQDGPLFFIVDGNGITDARHTMPSFTARPGQGIAIGLEGSTGEPLSLTVPPVHTAQFVIELHWCKSGMVGERDQVMVRL